MPSRSSFNKLFIYLTGLMVTCCLHLSCQFLSKLGAGEQATPVLEANEPPTTTDRQLQGIDINAIDIGMAGYPKGGGNPDIDGSIHRYGDDVCGYSKNENGITMVITDGSSHAKSVSGDYAKRLVCDVIPCNTKTSKNGEQGEAKTNYEGHGGSSTICGPKEMITKASKNGKQGEAKTNYEGHGGSSTICAVTINKQGLDYGNVGDCRVIVVRDNKIIHKSEGVSYGFNEPATLMDGGEYNHMVIKDSYSTNKDPWGLRKGDTVILSTDGLPDNVPDEQCINEIKPNHCAKEIAKSIATLAYNNSIDNTQFSPYMNDAINSAVKGNENAKYFILNEGKDRKEELRNLFTTVPSTENEKSKKCQQIKDILKTIPDFHKGGKPEEVFA